MKVVVWFICRCGHFGIFCFPLTALCIIQMLLANYMRSFATEEVCNTTGVTSGAAEFIPVLVGFVLLNL